MSNTLLTISSITREALRVLHQKCNFISNVNREYDDSFAKKGAKIGDTLRIRLPNQYVTRSGAALVAQDTVEQSVSLQVATQLGVDLNFTSADLTMSLDDFSKRIVDPAMSVLAAGIESDCVTQAVNATYNAVDNGAAATTFRNVLQARKLMVDNLTPVNSDWTALLNTQDNVDLIDALKGLFHEANAIEKQYAEGMMGRTAGYDFYENTLLANHTQGTHNTAYVVDGASQTGASLLIKTGTGTILKGDVFTIAGVFRAHPETKVSTAVLQQFTVTANSAGGAGTIAITPSIITSTSGGRQNVSAAPADAAVITFLAGASKVTSESLFFEKNAFTFATADLVMPSGVDMAARESMDGISMRMVRAYDINNDKFPTRVDVLYGFLATRAQTAARVSSNEV